MSTMQKLAGPIILPSLWCVFIIMVVWCGLEKGFTWVWTLGCCQQPYSFVLGPICMVRNTQPTSLFTSEKTVFCNKQITSNPEPSNHNWSWEYEGSLDIFINIDISGCMSGAIRTVCPLVFLHFLTCLFILLLSWTLLWTFCYKCSVDSVY